MCKCALRMKLTLFSGLFPPADQDDDDDDDEEGDDARGDHGNDDHNVRAAHLDQAKAWGDKLKI